MKAIDSCKLMFTIGSQKTAKNYCAFFDIEEISRSFNLRLLMLCQVLFSLINLSNWANIKDITKSRATLGLHMCWPYFQNCGDFYFLDLPNAGVSQILFYFCLGLLAVIGLYRFGMRRFASAHFLFSIIWIWEFIAVFFLNQELAANYVYFHLVLFGFLLFVKHKIFFVRIVYVVLYFIAATIKFTPGWVLGTQFTSLSSGLKGFPSELVPIACHFAIATEVFVSWMLLSRSHRWRIIAVLAFSAFHIYSAIYIGWRFPFICLTTLLTLFLSKDDHIEIPKSLGSLVGWFLVTCLIALQLFGNSISRDVNITLEGRYFGLYLLDANHQCRSTHLLRFRDGRVEQGEFESIDAKYRCDPYKTWFKLKEICRKNNYNELAIEWTFDHSINGGPFFRIVSTPNACNLEYKAFTHNDWIRLPDDGAEIVGYPVKNLFK